MVGGRVLDGAGRPVRSTLVEVWQANAAGRYAHDRDRHDAPLDPNFSGAGRCLTDDTGAFRFVTVRPGAYPWQNHHNAWRPAHIHLSVFGTAFASRLITQMYFPGDPLLAYDPIFQSVPRPGGPGATGGRLRPRRHRAGVGTRLPVRHRAAGTGGHAGRGPVTAGPTPSQTIGPFFAVALPDPAEAHLVEPGAAGAITLVGTVRDGAGDPVDDALLEVWQADPSGRYGPDATGRGFGRCLTDGAGRFAFLTRRPGRVPDAQGALQAPHIDVSVFARGLLDRLVTRIYFPDEEEANAVDGVLAALPDHARATLVAAPVEGGLRFDIHLQGERETTFFAV